MEYYMSWKIRGLPMEKNYRIKKIFFYESLNIIRMYQFLCSNMIIA